MRISPARRLIVGYAAVTALVDLSAFLPGGLDFSSFWGFVGAVVIQMLIVWRLWYGSSAAWLIAIAFAALTLVTLALMGPEAEIGIVLLFVVSGAQVVILWMRPVRALVWRFRTAPEPLRR